MELPLATLAFRDGRVILTDEHLHVVKPNGTIENSFALPHLSSVFYEECHSFRHRWLGCIASVVLLFGTFLTCGGIGLLTGQVAGMPRTSGLMGIGGVFSFFFSMVFLYGIVTSRRIHWLGFTYGTALRRIPLPGAGPEDVERFVDIMRKLGK